MYNFTTDFNPDNLLPHYDVIVVGGGHNGLVAAAYLAKDKKKVLVLEKGLQIGGATTSVKPFKGLDAYLSRYSYLVALMPQQIISDLNLDFQLLPRKVSSYTPDPSKPEKALLLSSSKEKRTNELKSFFKSEPGAFEFELFYLIANDVASSIASTFLDPLPAMDTIQDLIPSIYWDKIMSKPIGGVIKESITSDLLQGLIATDALIGHFVDMENDFNANLCLLYHLVSDWKVPKGGMGKLVDGLVKKCLEHNTHLITDAGVNSITLADSIQTVTFSHKGVVHKLTCDYVVSNIAPQYLNELVGSDISELAPTTPEAVEYHTGAQVKANLLLKRLPKLKSGHDPSLAFCGTFHVNESFSQLTKAYKQAKEGLVPDVIPCELYCHTLTDTSILSEELVAKGYHTLTLFALQLPTKLFEKDPESTKALVKKRILDGLNYFLAEPIEDCLALDEDGNPCIEFKFPQDLEAEISLPKGNIFHRYFSKPYLDTDENPEYLRGIETKHDKVLLCGSGAIRGGGVSGIPGYHAAKRIIEGKKPFFDKVKFYKEIQKIAEKKY